VCRGVVIAESIWPNDAYPDGRGINTVTGADTIGFQKRFTQQRRAQLPPWSHADRFEHFYCLATNTRIASTESGKHLRVGDSLVLS